jgi:hypothetical protein
MAVIWHEDFVPNASDLPFNWFVAPCSSLIFHFNYLLQLRGGDAHGY